MIAELPQTTPALQKRATPLDASQPSDDLRVTSYQRLESPRTIRDEFPGSAEALETVMRGRKEAAAILDRRDDRLLVVVGPCSIHDPDAALEYAKLLAGARAKWADTLCLVMRTYFEKPRSTVGWKGLVNDPNLDGSFDINRGLRIARALLCEINELGVPVASELLDTISPQYLSDLLSWGAIGARTTECQLHRELASGSSFPIGFKNGTDGSSAVAVDAIKAAAHPHRFIGVNKDGVAAIAATRGNPCTHVILRGGASGPTFDRASVERVNSRLADAKLPQRVMIDCSHGNSCKDYRRQPLVLSNVAGQVAAGSRSIVGLMIESNLREGSQRLVPGVALQRGVSITDGCVSWGTTEDMLAELSSAVLSRRAQFAAAAE